MKVGIQNISQITLSMLLINLFILIIYSSINYKSFHFNRDITRIGILLLLYIIYIQYDISIVSLINKSYYYNINTLSIYNDIYNINILTAYIILLILTLSILLLFNSISVLTSIKDIDNINYFNKNYIIIILFNIIGLVLFILSNNLIAIYVTIELQSYSLYIITSIYTKSNDSLKGGLLYFLIGGIASIIILYGLAILYYITGSLYINDINILLSYNNTIYIGYIILFIGLLIKTGLAPFHNWSLSVYNSTPTIITMWISIIAKISILTYLYNIYINIYNNINIIYYVDLHSIIHYILLISIILSFIIGTLGGLIQIKIKSLLIYSGILNGGYILFSILLYNIDSIVTYIIYITQYSITHFNIFIILLFIPSIIYNNNNFINTKNNIYTSVYSPILYIKQLSNLLIYNKFITLSLIISLLSLIGIPPLLGFYAKFYLFINGLSQGYYLLSILLLICSTISTLYYLYIIKEIGIYKNIYTKSTNDYISEDNNNNIYNNTLSYVISSITMIILFNSLQWYNILKGAYILSIIFI